MSEPLVLLAMVLAGVSGIPGLFLPREGRGGERSGAVLMTLAGICASAGAVAALTSGGAGELALAWSVPGGRMILAVDAISALFVIQIAVLAVLGSWYGLEYWPQSAHPDDGRKLRVFYGLVTAGMWLLVIARNGILFLVGWEIMALAAFMLVTTEDSDPEVREIGYVYLLATRAGTLCLFAMFALLGSTSGSLDFGGWPQALASPQADAIFLLGLLGFGVKAGILPLHVWLPGAHARAPSHVSALLSGGLIKMGIYGLVRLTAECQLPPPWWGYLLVASGVVSGVLGVGFAIGQHDIKRLLAYHSVENIGIICLGLGVAVLGRSLGRPELVALGVAGAMLHVWNHGLFKALLFLSAGSVLHATGTRDIDRLGGLWRRMPRTGLAFLVGAVAICGLPPLNGLISEFLIYLGLFRLVAESGQPWLAGALAAPSLALIGALALACFVKVFGAVFLGVARTDRVEEAHEAGVAMLLPMAILGATCLFIGLGAPAVAPVLDAVVLAWAGPGSVPVPGLVALAPLASVSTASGVLLASLALVTTLLTIRARTVVAPVPVGTWDCGYALPDRRMQYTSSSFAATLVGTLSFALRPAKAGPDLEGPFPARAEFRSHVPETVLDLVLQPGFSLAGDLLARLRPLQRGSVHLYLLYIVAALLALLLWR